MSYPVFSEPIPDVFTPIDGDIIGVVINGQYRRGYKFVADSDDVTEDMLSRQDVYEWKEMRGRTWITVLEEQNYGDVLQELEN